MSPHHPPASLRSRGEGRRHRSRPSDATSTIRSQAAVRPISHSRAPSKQTITNLDASPFAVTDRFSVEAVRSEINRIQRKFASAKLSISNEEAAIAAMDSLLGKPNIWEQALNRLIAVSNIMGQSSDDENDGSESVNSRSRGTSDRTVTSDHSRQSPIEVLQNDTETNFTQELDSDDEELRWSRMILASQMGPVFRLPSRDTLYRMEERRHLQQAQQGGGEKNESQTLSNKGNPDQIPVDLVYAITKQYHERHPDESSPMSGAIPWPEYAKMVKDQGTMEEEEEKKRLVQEDLLYNQPGANEGQILDTDSLRKFIFAVLI